MGRRAAFLDRDGVLNELVPDPVTGDPESPLAVSDVVIIEGAPEAALRLRAAGFLLVGVTNQPAAAKRSVSRETVEAVQQQVVRALEGHGLRLDAWRMCLHHPDGTDPELAGPCDCRKPAPGMLLDAAAEFGVDLASSWMIGDSDSDVDAGRAAGASTVIIENPASSHKRLRPERADLRSASLSDAVEVLIGRDGDDYHRHST